MKIICNIDNLYKFNKNDCKWCHHEYGLLYNILEIMLIGCEMNFEWSN